MIFRSPVRKPLHENSWKRPAGNDDFRVVQPFGCTGVKYEPALGSCAHFHRGLDLGDSKCFSDVLAPAAGTVRVSRTVLSGPSAGEEIIVLDHGGGWVTLYGHLHRRRVSKGDKVTKGQHIGDIGKTGITDGGCHLHWAAKDRVDLTQNPYSDSNGRWVDPWPLLEQNQPPAPAPEDDVYEILEPHEGAAAAIAPKFYIRSEPTTSSKSKRLVSDGERWPRVVGYVLGETVGGDPRWLMRINASNAWEFAHASGVAGLAPLDCGPVVEAATAELRAELTTLSSSRDAKDAALDQIAASAAQGRAA